MGRNVVNIKSFLFYSYKFSLSYLFQCAFLTRFILSVLSSFSFFLRYLYQPCSGPSPSTPLLF